MTKKNEKTKVNNANYWRFLSNPEKFKKHWDKKKYDLKIETTKRQFDTARCILERLKIQKGVLLADDVGMGKTAVATLVACVFAEKGNTVQILAPNKTMQTKWKMEIDNHIEILRSFKNNLKLKRENVHKGPLKKLKPYNILVSTHTKSLHEFLDCDLLIVDEAHRAKGENSSFANKIINKKNTFEKVLILTATPFSINIKELNRMLKIVEASDFENVSAYDEKLKELWEKDDLIDIKGFSEELKDVAEKAVESLGPHIIRHSIEYLEKNEIKHFGEVRNLDIDVENANPNDYEILIRADRLLELCKKNNLWSKSRTNDARYHVGWNKLKEDIKEIEEKLKIGTEKEHEIIGELINEIKSHLNERENHPKAVSVAKCVKGIVEDKGEKVLIFCDYHSTAAELTCLIASTFKRRRIKTDEQLWIKSWEQIIPENNDHYIHRQNFITWLSSPNIRSQVADWIGNVPNDSEKLVKILEKIPARKSNTETISKAAIVLWHKLIDKDSKSTSAVLKNLSKGSIPSQFGTTNRSKMPGMPHDGRKKMPVISTANFNDFVVADLKYLFFPDQIDTVMAVFNSPFGPDVLVTTDRLSEGIDLHGCCRYLIHYELDPSPIRTIQRNGRIRRVNSWAAKTKKPIRIAYPVFKGTRDEKLVKIMRDRLCSFDLLLGGVGGKIDIDDNNEAEKYRLEVIDRAKSGLKKLSLALKNCEHKKIK